jgi:hypothetical protein
VIEIRRTWMSVVALAALVAMGVVTAFPKDAASAKADTKLDKKDLPAAVITAFQKAYSKAAIKGVSKEMKDSVQYYEIESKDGKTERSILYLPDGTAYEVEEEVAATSLPDPVKASIGQAYPKGKIEKAEMITRGAVVEYEIKVALGKEKSEIVLDKAGKVLKSEKADGKVEKDKEEED